MGYSRMEKLPNATSSDMTGMKKIRVSKVDREGDGVPSTTGAKAPKAALSSDTTGERRAPIAGGVGMGKADGLGLREASHMGKNDGRMGEMKGHMGEKVVYEHMREAHEQDKM